MGLHDGFYQIKAEPQTAVFPARGCLFLSEAIENNWDKLRIHTSAVVTDGKLHNGLTTAERKGDPSAFRRVPKGIFQQIPEDLTQADWIALNGHRLKLCVERYSASPSAGKVLLNDFLD